MSRTACASPARARPSRPRLPEHGLRAAGLARMPQASRGLLALYQHSNRRWHRPPVRVHELGHRHQTLAQRHSSSLQHPRLIAHSRRTRRLRPPQRRITQTRSPAGCIHATRCRRSSAGPTCTRREDSVAGTRDSLGRSIWPSSRPMPNLACLSSGTAPFSRVCPAAPTIITPSRSTAPSNATIVSINAAA